MKTLWTPQPWSVGFGTSTDAAYWNMAASGSRASRWVLCFCLALAAAWGVFSPAGETRGEFL